MYVAGVPRRVIAQSARARVVLVTVHSSSGGERSTEPRRKRHHVTPTHLSRLSLRTHYFHFCLMSRPRMRSSHPIVSIPSSDAMWRIDKAIPCDDPNARGDERRSRRRVHTADAPPARRGRGGGLRSLAVAGKSSDLELMHVRNAFHCTIQQNNLGRRRARSKRVGSSICFVTPYALRYT